MDVREITDLPKEMKSKTKTRKPVKSFLVTKVIKKLTIFLTISYGYIF